MPYYILNILIEVLPISAAIPDLRDKIVVGDLWFGNEIILKLLGTDGASAGHVALLKEVRQIKC